MKFSIIFVVLCLVAYSTQTPKYEDCDDAVKEFFNEKQCLNVVCFSFKNETLNISKMSANSCPFPRCDEGKELKKTTPGDETAVYPACCATPLCE